MCEAGPTNQDKYSEVTISLRKLSQILAAAGISILSSQGEHILIEIKNLSIPPKIIQEPQSHELQPISPYQSTKEPKTWRLHSMERDLKLKSSPHIY